MLSIHCRLIILTIFVWLTLTLAKVCPHFRLITTVKIGLERVDTQEGITVEALLDSGMTGLVMSSEFTRKQEFKLKKIERPIYVRNIDGSFNKKRPIKHMVETNIYYQKHRGRIEIDIIGGQKWSVILEMP